MPDPASSDAQRQIQQQQRRVQGLRAAVFGQPDPSANAGLREQLVDEEAKLQTLQLQAAGPPTSSGQERSAPTTPRGRFLGAKTTGLRVEPTLNMQPIPTGVYHLLDPETDPLLTVVVANESRDARRICVKAYLEGLSAQAVRTVEVEPRKDVTLRLLPTLLPDRVKEVTEIQRATLHVIAEDLDGKLESHDTFSLVCLARTSSFNSVRRPDTGQTVDLSHYYGAWVTPHAEAVQKCIRRAADLLKQQGIQICGYQGDPESVTKQVAALYQALKESEVVYINSVIDYGAPAGQATQRTRLPRESLAIRSANCIDGTVLLASLIEGASLNPAIVLIPGHAFVGWEKWDGVDEWQYLETTLIGSADFDAACQSGQRQFEEYQKFSKDRVKVHKLTDLRARGIWPME